MHRHVAGVPFADPDAALRIRPHAARALVRGSQARPSWRCRSQDRSLRCGCRRASVPDVALRRDGHAVAAASARRLPHLHVAGLRIEPAVVAALAGEPVDAGLVERRGVEIGVVLERQLEHRDLVVVVDAHDRVLPAVRDPRGLVRPDDHAMRRGARPEVDQLVGAVARIEPAELAVALAVEPHRDAVAARRSRRASAAASGTGKYFTRKFSFVAAGAGRSSDGGGEGAGGAGREELAAIHGEAPKRISRRA